MTELNTRKYQPPRMPTDEECRAHANIGDGWVALWSPQMAGYVGVAAARATSGGCVDVWIWHDGEFPLHEDDEDGPWLIHYCDPQRLVTFGQQLLDIEKKTNAGDPT